MAEIQGENGKRNASFSLPDGVQASACLMLFLFLQAEAYTPDVFEAVKKENGIDIAFVKPLQGFKSSGAP